MQYWAILILCFFLKAKTANGEWSYSDANTGPSTWAKSSPACGGTLQSPVNINYNDAVYDANLGEVNFLLKSGVALNGKKYTVENNGHSISILFPSDMWKLKLNSAPAGEFEVAGIHFHWGSSNNVGSEHTRNNNRYGLETHIVCFKKDMYGDLETAKKSPGGLAVVGIFHEADDSVEKSETQIGILGRFETIIANKVLKDHGKSIDAFDLTAILKQINPSKYFRYPGSLTTPPCTQNVIWTVMYDVVKITPKQLELFRKQPLAGGTTQTAENYRPVQPLNSPSSLWKRTIYRSWNASKPLRYSTFTVFSLIIALICRYYASG